MTRREALSHLGGGFGMFAFASMLGHGLAGATRGLGGNPMAVKAPHFPASAKRVIFLFLTGGMSQVDTFDPKPMLDKYDGKPLPYETPLTENATGNLMPSPFSFKKCGQSGIEVSEIFPKLAGIIDDFCVIRSMHTDIPNHGPSMMMMNSGLSRQGRRLWVLGLPTDLAPKTRICLDSSCFAPVGRRGPKPRCGIRPSCRRRTKGLLFQTRKARQGNRSSISATVSSVWPSSASSLTCSEN